MDSYMLDLLVCPSCKGQLTYHQANTELICRVERLAYPISNGIPVMLVEEARKISLEEYDRL